MSPDVAWCCWSLHVCVCSCMLLLDATLCCNVLYGDVWCYVLDVQSCSGMQTVVVCCYMTSNTVVSCTMLLVGITWCSLVLLVTACMCVFLYVVVRCYLMQWCVEWGHTMSCTVLLIDVASCTGMLQVVTSSSGMFKLLMNDDPWHQLLLSVALCCWLVSADIRWCWTAWVCVHVCCC